MPSRRKGPLFGRKLGALASARAWGTRTWGTLAWGTLAQMVLAALAAVAVSVVSLAAIRRVQWPAYPSSNQLHALTTVGQVGCLAGLIGCGWAWRSGVTQFRRWLAQLGAVLFCSAFAVVTLAMPLGATKLYLFGISVDQQFSTEYLTRLTDSPTLCDMTYFGLPPFYPPGWFWLGGRAAALTGSSAWEMYKPWAITSITVAAAVALAYSSPEPYAAMITVLLPPVLVLAWAGLRAAGADHSGWGAVAGTGVFLGFAATFYTLLVAYSAFTVTLMALLLAAARAWRNGLKAAVDPLARLAVIAVIAATIASTAWLPFLLRAARDPVSDTGSFRHYLPRDGAELAFPMLQFTLLGALCLLGTLWLLVRVGTSVRAAALGIGVVGVYLWSLLSMLTTLARTTLLSFRLQPTLTVLLAVAGVFGFVEVTHVLARRSATLLPAA